MRYIYTTIILTVVLAASSGCGQLGPLYTPTNEEEPEAVILEEPTDTSVDSRSIDSTPVDSATIETSTDSQPVDS